MCRHILHILEFYVVISTTYVVVINGNCKGRLLVFFVLRRCINVMSHRDHVGETAHIPHL